MDGAVIFADIMTPLEAMGVEMTFDPGPRLAPHSLDEVVALDELIEDRISFVMETVRRVSAGVPSEVATIGFSGGPMTLLAYLIEGGGSKDFVTLRGAVRRDPKLATAALEKLAVAMNRYLAAQIAAGAQVVQLFDSWAGVFGRDFFNSHVAPSARLALHGLDSPTIYFAPGAGHTLDLQNSIGATGYGVDWRLSIDDAWERLGGEVRIQGNIDPAVLLTDEESIRKAVADLFARTNGRPGHIVNLGHGIDRNTPVKNVASFVSAVRDTELGTNP